MKINKGNPGGPNPKFGNINLAKTFINQATLSSYLQILDMSIENMLCFLLNPFPHGNDTLGALHIHT